MSDAKSPGRESLAFLRLAILLGFAALASVPVIGLFGLRADLGWFPAAISAAGLAAIFMYTVPARFLARTPFFLLAYATVLAALAVWAPIGIAIAIGTVAGIVGGGLCRSAIDSALAAGEPILVTKGSDSDADRVLEEISAEVLERARAEWRARPNENVKILAAHMKRARLRRQDEQRPEHGDEPAE